MLRPYILEPENIFDSSEKLYLYLHSPQPLVPICRKVARSAIPGYQSFFNSRLTEYFVKDI